VRVASTYAGYRVLHHEIYETSTSEPLLVFLGLWLCGIAPATFFDQLRRIGVSLQSELDKQTGKDVGSDLPKPELPSVGIDPEEPSP
jgi:hypothetical protein